MWVKNEESFRDYQGFYLSTQGVYLGNCIIIGESYGREYALYRYETYERAEQVLNKIINHYNMKVHGSFEIPKE